MDKLIPADFSLSGYGFDLPERLIAQTPASGRAESRLLVLDRKTGCVCAAAFADILKFLPPESLLVANNSKVIPARLFGRRQSGGKVEFLLLTPVNLLEIRRTGDGKNKARARGLLRSSKQVKEGEAIELAPGLSLTLAARGSFGNCEVELSWQGDLLGLLSEYGKLPLPPYIRRDPEAKDLARYQTTYARDDKAGSAAAPTAGLHFTPELRQALKDAGHEWAEATLYVGYGTFSPVRCPDIREHAMHAEYFELPPETADAVNRAKAGRRPVIAVGTTSARILEGAFLARKDEASAGTPEARLRPSQGWTDIFLYPGKPFNVVDSLITNFHLPESSLLMLVSAFAGRERIQSAYNQAIAQNFRFFSYGDAMFII